MRNPILFREFTGIARAGKTSFIIGLYLVLLAGLLLILWPSGGVQSVVTDGAKKIFAIFFSVNLALLLLIIPAFSSGAITSERENGTYPALFFTLLSPWDILLGKLGAAAAIVVIMTLFSMPMAAVCSLATMRQFLALSSRRTPQRTAAVFMLEMEQPQISATPAVFWQPSLKTALKSAAVFTTMEPFPSEAAT